MGRGGCPAAAELPHQPPSQGPLLAVLPTAPTKTTIAEEATVARRYTPEGVAWDTVAASVFPFTLYAAVCCAAVYGRLSYGVASLILGVATHQMYYPMHEALHGNITKGYSTGLAERIVGHICGVFLMYDFDAHREMHLAHHRHVNDELLDPDIFIGGTFAGLLAKWVALLLLQAASAVPYAGAVVASRAVVAVRGRTAEADPMRPHREGMRVWHQRCVAVCVLLAAAGAGWEAALLWYVPAQLGTLFRLITGAWLPHHPHAGTGRYDSARVMVFGPPWVNAAVTAVVFGGGNYHAMHHMFPRVPGFRLAGLFAELRAGLEANGLRVEGAWGSGEAARVRVGPPAHAPRSGPFADGFASRRKGESPPLPRPSAGAD